MNNALRLKAREHDIQRSIVDALRLAGFSVRETTAYRQKGPSGVDKGIADLLVWNPCFAPYVALCIEVKRPGPVRWSSREQGEAFDAGEFAVAQSPEQALEIAIEELKHSNSKATQIYLAKAQSVLDALRRAA